MTVRVLTVDDSPAYLQAMADVLAATPGFEVVAETTSGDEAVRLAGEIGVDLVLMDVRMPGTDGYEAGRRIGALEGAPLVVLLSADREADDQPCSDDATVIDKRDLRPALLERLWAEASTERRAPC